MVERARPPPTTPADPLCVWSRARPSDGRLTRTGRLAMMTPGLILLAWTTGQIAHGDRMSADMALSLAREKAFERVYNEGRWVHGADGAMRCKSGWSDVDAYQGSAALRAIVHVIETYRIHSLADIPCGDGCFAGAVLGALRNRTAAQMVPAYTGVDIVRSLVDHNNARLGDSTTRFIHADVVLGATPLPITDLIFSRHMLQHMCTEDALRFVRLVARSTARFALLSTFETDDAFVNDDIPCDSGGFRAQDLTKPPFNLPRPIAIFNEQYPVDMRVSLGLWPIRQLRHRLL